MSVMTVLNRFIAFLFTMTFISTATAMGFGPFYLMMAIVCAIMLAYIYVFLPETKGKSLEDMHAYFAEVTHDVSTLEKDEEIRQKVSTMLDGARASERPHTLEQEAAVSG